MRLKWGLLAAVLGIAGYIGYSQWHAPASDAAVAAKPQSAVPVDAVKVRSGDLSVTLSTVGTLKSDESVILKPEIAGRVDMIHVAEGAAANKGEPLISIDSRVAEAELKQAEAALGLARVSYDRAKLLKEKGAGTVSNFDTMQAALRVAQAQVDLSSAKLDKMRIIAPFDGVMGLRHISPGDYVNVGQDLAGFHSDNPMKAEFTLPESATSVVAAGQMIDVHVDALPDRVFQGKVYAIDPQIDESSRNITLRALIPNDDNALKPGLFARVSIITAHKDNALFVPESAIVPRGNDSFVMRIDAEKKVATVKVVTGERRNGEVEIISGLRPDDVVVTAGHLKLHDGQEVSYPLAAPVAATAGDAQ